MKEGKLKIKKGERGAVHCLYGKYTNCYLVLGKNPHGPRVGGSQNQLNSGDFRTS